MRYGIGVFNFDPPVEVVDSGGEDPVHSPRLGVIDRLDGVARFDDEELVDRDGIVGRWAIGSGGAHGILALRWYADKDCAGRGDVQEWAFPG